MSYVIINVCQNYFFTKLCHLSLHWVNYQRDIQGIYVAIMCNSAYLLRLLS